MKRKLKNYTFSKKEIRILKVLVSGHHSLFLIRKELSIKPSYLSKNLKQLCKKGIIRFQKKKHIPKRFKNWKYVYFDKFKHATLLHELLLMYKHIKWEDVLSGLGIEILFHVLDNFKISFENFSKITFWRYSKEFMALGLLNFDERGYSLNSRFSLLKDFLREYQKYILNKLVRSISKEGTILWQKGFDCLIRLPKNSRVTEPRFLKTATSRLGDFGVPIFSNFDIYYYSNKKKTIHKEDVLLHTLLIERDNVRYVTYALLLLKKNGEIDKKYLLKESQKFELLQQINSMLEFLETKGEKHDYPLPTWNEFLTKALEYGVVD
jgi:predicted transcriptional regulator